MTPGRDDDALSWSGDDDPTLEIGPAADGAAIAEVPAKTNLPDGFTPVGKGSGEFAASTRAADAAALDADTAEDATEPDEPGAGERRPMGNATLISLGVLGGVYALYAIGWLIGGLRLQGSAQYLVTDIMFQGSLWLAVLSPVLWFATVFLLTRGAPPWARFAWLAAGVVLLLPWPFVMIGAVGQ